MELHEEIRKILDDWLSANWDDYSGAWVEGKEETTEALVKLFGEFGKTTIQ